MYEIVIWWQSAPRNQHAYMNWHSTKLCMHVGMMCTSIQPFLLFAYRISFRMLIFIHSSKCFDDSPDEGENFMHNNQIFTPNNCPRRSFLKAGRGGSCNWLWFWARGSSTKRYWPVRNLTGYRGLNYLYEYTYSWWMGHFVFSSRITCYQAIISGQGQIYFTSWKGTKEER